MSSILRTVVLSVGILVLFSCASIEWESNKAPDYSQKIASLYIMVNVPELTVTKTVPSQSKMHQEPDKYVGVKFGDYLKDDLLDAFAKSNIPVQATALGGLEMDLSEAKDAARQMGAKATLIVELTGKPEKPDLATSLLFYPKTVTNTFYVTISDSELDKPIWKARYPMSTVYGYNSSEVDQMVKKLMATLRKDALLEE